MGVSVLMNDQKKVVVSGKRLHWKSRLQRDAIYPFNRAILP
jgi:hypothetical protein